MKKHFSKNTNFDVPTIPPVTEAKLKKPSIVAKGKPKPKPPSKPKKRTDKTYAARNEKLSQLGRILYQIDVNKKLRNQVASLAKSEETTVSNIYEKAVIFYLKEKHPYFHKKYLDDK